MRGVLPIVVMAVLAAGCGREQAPDREAADAARERADAVAVLERAAELMAGGETNAALDAVTDALADPAYAEGRVPLVRYLVRAQLAAGRTAEAEQTLMHALTAEDGGGGGSLGMIFGYYLSRGDTTQALRWARALQDAALPERYASTVLGMLLHATYAAGAVEDALALVPQAVAAGDDAQVKRILGGTLAEALAADDVAAAAAMLDAAEAEAGERAALGSFVAAWRIRLKAEQGAWEEADRLLRASADKLADRDLRDCFAMVTRQAAADAPEDYVGSLAMFLLTQAEDKPLSRRAAAERWLRERDARGLVKATPDALAKLRELGLPARDVFGYARRWFYKVLGTDDQAAMQNMVAFVDALSAELEDERLRADARSMLMDGAFTLNDFARAATLVDQGIPGRDEAWHEMAANKIRAHLAQKEGPTDEAIERFRAFMDHVKTWDKAQVDPSTGLAHTREMTLGRNARRIAGLYASAGRTNEAAAAMEEAMAYYRATLEELEPGSAEYKLVKQEMDDGVGE